MPALPMAIMARSGFRVASSSEPGPGITVRRVSTATSITLWMFGRAIEDLCRDAVNVPRPIGWRFAARLCIARVDARPPAAAGREAWIAKPVCPNPLGPFWV